MRLPPLPDASFSSLCDCACLPLHLAQQDPAPECPAWTCAAWFGSIQGNTRRGQPAVKEQPSTPTSPIPLACTPSTRPRRAAHRMTIVLGPALRASACAARHAALTQGACCWRTAPPSQQRYLDFRRPIHAGRATPETGAKVSRGAGRSFMVRRTITAIINLPATFAGQLPSTDPC